MDDSELTERIVRFRADHTDSADFEAKRGSGLKLPNACRETLSSFSNTAGGGVLVLGLAEDESESASGVEDAKKFAADLASLCAMEMQPPVRPIIKINDFEGVKLVSAEIPEITSALKPCYYVGAGISNGSYVRVNDGDYHLTSYEVQMMIAARGQPREDEHPVSGLTREALDPKATKTFIERVRESRPYAFEGVDEQEILRQLKVLVRDDDGSVVPSVAGLLTLGKYPQTAFPQLNLTFVHYPTPAGGDSHGGDRFLDNKSIEGSIPVMVHQALAVLRVNMTRRGQITGAGRQDSWEYPETALREVIVNALCHRDLSPTSRGTPVQVEMYPDRLVVKNPGGLFGPVNIYQLGEDGISSSRNATLLKILEDVELPGESRTVCENRGSGIKAMIRSLRDAGMVIPEFQPRVASFQVTFPNATLMSESTVQWIESLNEEGLTEAQVVGLALLRDGSVLTNGTYRASTGVDSRVATSELQDLVARGLAIQIGQNRWAQYQLRASVSVGNTQNPPRGRNLHDCHHEIDGNRFSMRWGQANCREHK